MAVHYELQAYRTHTQMHDYRIASQESLMTTLVAHVSSLQGQLSAALGQIQALQARGQTQADGREGAASTAVELVFSFLVSDNHPLDETDHTDCQRGNPNSLEPCASFAFILV
ncbi:hypothetical protein Tco_0373604 [Tanacetum coccineum]